MKKLIAFVLAACLCMSGCTPSIRLSKRAVVQTLGLDYKDGEYSATMALYGPSGTSAESISLISATGETLTTLFSQASVSQGKQLFLGNLRLFVLGRSLTENGLQEALSFLSKFQQISPATEVVAAQNDAAELMKDTQTVSELLDALSTAQSSGELPESKMLDLLDTERDQVLPILITVPDKTENASTASEGANSQTTDKSSSTTSAQSEQEPAVPQKIKSGGGLLLSQGTARLTLTPDMVKGYCWFTRRWRTAVLETTEPRTASVVKKAKNRIDANALDDQFVFLIHTDIRSTLLENFESDLQYEDIIKAQTFLVQKQLDTFFAKVYRQGYDPLGLATYLPREAQTEDTRMILRKAVYDIRVSCSIDKKGTTL